MNHITLHDCLHSKELSSELIDVLTQIALTCKTISRKVRAARLNDVLGSAGTINIQGEVQEKLDVISNGLLFNDLSQIGAVAECASEEEEDSVVFNDAGQFIVIFDPLDGSTNIDVAAGVGTIFSILPNTDQHTLQPGRSQVAAGYVLYGSSVLLVLTTGTGVDVFVLDPVSDDFCLVKEGLQVPPETRVYSINEAYFNDFPMGYQDYLHFAHDIGFSSRYIGSMVADVHRTLLKGGVFLYPPTADKPGGKLRLLCEANPMAFITEQAGGEANSGTERILDIIPEQLHQRIPVILGSSMEVSRVLGFI